MVKWLWKLRKSGFEDLDSRRRRNIHRKIVSTAVWHYWGQVEGKFLLVSDYWFGFGLDRCILYLQWPQGADFFLLRITLWCLGTPQSIGERFMVARSVKRWAEGEKIHPWRFLKLCINSIPSVKKRWRSGKILTTMILLVYY